MDDPVIFENFLLNVLGVNILNVRNEIVGFANNFASLLSVSDSEIDDFVKATHSSNSGRAAEARILISPNATIALKSILFELKFGILILDT